MRKKISFFNKFIWSLLGVLFLSSAITAFVFYGRIYQSNVSLDYQKEVFIYIPSNAILKMYFNSLQMRELLLILHHFDGFQKESTILTTSNRVDT